MQVTCETCHARYDDAVCWTYCPHDRFISDEVAARKDLAYSLLGKKLLFDGIPTYVEAISGNGMVDVKGFRGEFAPHLFTVVEGVDA